jgi:hypothetical protein
VHEIEPIKGGCPFSHFFQTSALAQTQTWAITFLCPASRTR